VVSFAKESPAFSSFGFEMGENAPVSEDAAAGYALGLNELLAGDDTHFNVGGITFCFWAEKNSAAVGAMGRMLNTAKPAVVADFMKSPFAGVERSVAKKDAFLSVALTANAGRVVVREWLRVPLDEAIENFRRWFAHLEITPLGDGKDDADTGPYSLSRLAAAMVRVSKDLDRMSDAVALLYRAAWEGTAPPLRLLEPILSEFRSALVTDSSNDPKYPMNQSRFALLKLILTRHAKKGGFMPAPYLCETDDAAYNLGRLLCILAALQDAAHDYKLEGPGIVERYYGTASAAPANVFGVLWKLHVHHLRKLEQGDGGGAAYRIRNQIADVVAGFPPAGPNQPPQFPSTLTLEEQGRFALGFYQQMAADRRAKREAIAKKTETPTTTPE
jgi:CRISPR-associated protein Csd1